jgi:hypothetical protein
VLKKLAYLEPLQNIYTFNKATLCEPVTKVDKNPIYARQCVERKCKECGISKLMLRLQTNLGDKLDNIVTWSEWIKEVEEIEKDTNEGHEMDPEEDKSGNPKVKKERTKRKKGKDKKKRGRKDGPKKPKQSQIVNKDPEGDENDHPQEIKERTKKGQGKDKKKGPKDQEPKKKKQSRIVKKVHQDKLSKLLESLKESFETISQHLHVASWQYSMYNISRSNPMEGDVVMVSDFAENYRNEHQLQPKSVHWSYTQTTIHPCVVFYQCPTPGCTEVVKESIIGLSADLKHDCQAAAAFEQNVINHLIEVRRVPIKTLSMWSDGGSHYKSKNAFLLATARCQPQNNFKVQRNYFGADHGKSLSDGEGAVVKSTLSKMVKANVAFIDNAKQAYEMLGNMKQFMPETNIHDTHNSRMVQMVTVNRTEMPETLTLQGTRQIHSIQAIQYGRVAYRNLSCVCEGCRSGTGRCHYSDFVDQFKQHDLLSSDDRGKETWKEFMTNKDKPKSNGSRPAATPYTDSERKGYFNNIQKDMVSCKSFRDFKSHAKIWQEEIEEKFPLPKKLKNGTIDIDNIDPKAMELCPTEEKSIAVSIIGDGNCGPRSGSKALFGRQDFHQEMRVRIALEMATFEEYYQSSVNLEKGLPASEQRKDLAKFLSMFMEEDHTWTKWSFSVLQELYRYLKILVY